MKLLISTFFCVFAAFNVAQGIDINCEYVTSGWYVTGDIKNCYVERLDARSPQLLIESVDGDNSTVHHDVKGVWIKDQVCWFIPEGWTQFFPDLIAFGLDNTHLKRLSKFDLQPFPSIIRFSVYRGELEFLEADVFMYNTKLQSISLTDNNLMIIGSTTFANLPQLYYAQVEIKCHNTKCESKGCIPDLKKNLEKKCQSDDIIKKFEIKIQTLKNYLLRC